MATANIQSIGITSVTSKELEDSEKDYQKRRQIKSGVINGTDSLEIATSKAGVAHSAEAQGPKVKGVGAAKGTHEGLVAAKSTVEKLLKEAGVTFSPKDLESAEDLETLVLQTIEGLESELEGEGGQFPAGPRKAKLIRLCEKLTKAVEEYRTQYMSVAALQDESSQLTADSFPLTPDSSQPSADSRQLTADSSQSTVTPEEAKIWKTLEVHLEKNFGIKVGKEKDPEKIQTKLFESFNKKLKTFKIRESEIKAQVETLKVEVEKAQKTKDPETVHKLTEQAKVLVKELKEIAQQKALLQKSFASDNALIEQGLRIRTERELGIKAAEHSTSSPTLLGSQSVGEEADSRQLSALSSQPAAHKSGPALVGAQSAGSEEADSSQLTADSSSAPMLDISGIGLSIASQGFSMKSEAKKTEKEVKKLLAAALSGNWEACKACLIFLDKRASMLTIGIAGQTIKAMQYYEKQMGALSGSIGKLDGKSPDYSGKLAQINSQMNMYSLNRQSIANFLRDTMSLREEVGNLTHSVLQKDGQISSSLSRG